MCVFGSFLGNVLASGGGLDLRAVIFFFLNRVSFYILCGRGKGGKNVRRWIAKGRRRAVVGECGFFLARRRCCYRKSRRRFRCHHHRHCGLYGYGEGLIPHLFAKLPGWVFVGLRSLLILASCLVRKIVGPGCCCGGVGGGRGERA